MTSVDELFKKSGLPSKRKLDPVRDPNEIYKSAKLSNNGNSRRAHVEDEADDDDVEAGPAPPPDGDEDDDGDYGPAAPPDDDEGDDEEGRFFGGGITRQEAVVLEYVEQKDDAGRDVVDDEKIDAAWLRRTALAFEKKISRNAELRARHADDPARFIDSEADLDAAVRGLSILGEHPSLYPDFARVGSAASLASLLSHENTDVALAAVQIIGELTGDDSPASDAEWGSLTDALLEADLLPLLVSNLGRLDEDGEDDADREGVYRILEVVENLCGRLSTAEAAGRDDALLRWLLARVKKPEPAVSQNRQYAAEILAILAQASPANRMRLAALDDAVDAMLQLVAPYRERDPAGGGGDEEEYMENLFEALTCIVDSPQGKHKFVEAEGPALCLVLAQSGKKPTRVAALRLLDHAAAQASSQPQEAAGGSEGGADVGRDGSGTAVCENIVEYGGLKTLFTLFMKKKTDPRMVEHLVAIFAWMLRLLSSGSAERIRTLAKFVEKDYEKSERLVRLRREHADRVAVVDAQIEREKEVLDEEEREAEADDWFSRRMAAGLFCLQTIDVILAWLVAEDSGARKKIRDLLAARDESFALIRASLQEQLDGVDASTEDGRDVKEMLSTLIEFLA